MLLDSSPIRSLYDGEGVHDGIDRIPGDMPTTKQGLTNSLPHWARLRRSNVDESVPSRVADRVVDALFDRV